VNLTVLFFINTWTLLKGFGNLKLTVVLFVKNEDVEFATIFDIKTDLLMTYDTFANAMAGTNCRVPNAMICPDLEMFDGYPAMTATQQTIWSKDIAMTRQQKFIFINSVQSASEWYTIDAPKLNGFRIFLEQRPSVKIFTMPQNLKFEINFLFKRMK